MLNKTKKIASSNLLNMYPSLYVVGVFSHSSSQLWLIKKYNINLKYKSTYNNFTVSFGFITGLSFSISLSLSNQSS